MKIKVHIKERIMRKKYQMWFNLVMVVLCMVGIGVIAYISHRMHTPPQPQPSEKVFNVNEARAKWQAIEHKTNDAALNYEDCQ